MTSPRPNRLATESSPYLRQHATNPVDWYPWGEEAFAASRREDRPILLSVGYSSCHWCHVMAHESFEDPQVTELMNAWFINIKVDREERPDIDSVYMAALQALTGQGGWPMTIFLTPGGEPFFAGTYFPPADAHGRPGFSRLLGTIHDAWLGRREALLASAAGIADHLRLERPADPEGAFVPSESAVREAVKAIARAFDPQWGGFGSPPKFPAPTSLEFLLAFHAQDPGGDEGALEMVLLTLDRMAGGGIHDQLGGGFARYSVDRQWLVPHFEKMLYDNAQLARLYLHAFQLTGDPRHEKVARSTLDYLLRELRDPEGGFYAAQDADSDGIEGRYYVWTAAELGDVLGSDAGLFCAAFGATPAGNFLDPHHPGLTGRSVLSRVATDSELAVAFGLSGAEVAARIESARALLFRVRSQRVPPGLDGKVLTSWNGLALAAFSEAARVLDDAAYHGAARQNAAFVRERLWRDGRLLHSYCGGSARIEGMLEDYAFYGLGLVELYKLTGDLAHLEWARELLESILHDFRDEDHGGFFETRGDGEVLLLRPKPLFDAAAPSGNAAAALLALWLSRYYGNGSWEQAAAEALQPASPYLAATPSGLGSMWQVAAFLLSPPHELVILGEPAARRPFEREASRHYLPWLAIAPSAGGGGLPLLQGREDASVPLACLCEHWSCRIPARSVPELAHQLSELA